jgi:hypothetical protein
VENTLGGWCTVWLYMQLGVWFWQQFCVFKKMEFVKK